MTRRRETLAEGRARRAAVDDPAAVLDAAARFLEVRPRSTAEVRRRLGQSGYRADLVEGAIDRLADLGMLDDEAFARAWVESRDRARPRGERALRAELRRMGLAAADVEAALAARDARAVVATADGPGPGTAASERGAMRRSEEDAATRLLDRRGAALRREADPRRRRAKAYALLARNGFDPDVAGRAVTAWLGGAFPDPDA